MINDYSLSEFNDKKNMILSDFKTKFKSVENPKTYLIVGQPGAGKSTLANYFYKSNNKNIIFINGDDFRQYHPNYKKICDYFGDDSVEYTKKFSGEMTEALINELSDQKYNLIIEGTLRTVTVPIMTRNILKNKEYNITLACMLVRPEISYLSTIKRYEMMKELNIPRKTSKEHHDLVVKSIIDNLDKIYQQEIFDNIQIFNRNSEILYDLLINNKENPANLFRKEFFRKLTKIEREIIYNDFNKYIDKDEIDKVLNGYNNLKNQMVIENIENYKFINAYEIFHSDKKPLDFLKEVVKIHGTDIKILNSAIEIVTKYENEVPEFKAKLLNDILNTEEYKQAYNKEYGKSVENSKTSKKLIF